MVVGSGAREHTLVWKLTHSPKVEDIYVAPGNAGTEAIARNITHRFNRSWTRSTFSFGYCRPLSKPRPPYFWLYPGGHTA
jgi:phosphoribosylamine--glycine ligase